MDRYRTPLALEYRSVLITSIVLSAVVDFISIASGHLECTSTSTKNIRPLKGPAKSMCNRCQGREGHTHGLRGATAGMLLVDLHARQSLAICSSDLSTPGHQR